jgi:hypothetical protein
MNPLTQPKNTTILPRLIVIALACFALSPTAQAVSPPPDGGYPGGNTAEGEDALFSLTGGVDNTALGFRALYNNTGSFNTATGSFALFHNTTGLGNTATGIGALNGNTTGDHNTATGSEALFFNTTGFDNTATGSHTLIRNEGDRNTATGSDALFSNTTGFNNTASGYSALVNNTDGDRNTASGSDALFSNTTGSFNTASGSFVLLSNTTGSNNTATGSDALFVNTTGSFNIALGYRAGSNLTTGDDNIDIGNRGVAGEAGTIRVGTQGTQTATYIAGISGTPLGAGVAVRVNTSGQLGTVGSSARFKQNIQPMDKASEAIHALKPVTFHYKKELDSEGIPQFGLVAEEVATVNPALVARDDKGKVYTVRYEAVNAMLLNEFLKEHRKVEAQQATITQLKSTVAQQKKDFQATVAQLTARLDEQAAQIQKVSAQIEMSKPAPQVVNNP